MQSKISSIGLLILVFSVIVVSGCILNDPLDDVNESESNGVKHFEGKGISFNAPNTWALCKIENVSGYYLFSIGRGTGGNIDLNDLISFHVFPDNRTLSEAIKSDTENCTLDNETIISEKELTVNGLPAFQRTTHNNNNITVTYVFFMKNGNMYAIFAVPMKGKNFTTIEADLEMVLNTFRTL